MAASSSGANASGSAAQSQICVELAPVVDELDAEVVLDELEVVVLELLLVVVDVLLAELTTPPVELLLTTPPVVVEELLLEELTLDDEELPVVVVLLDELLELLLPLVLVVVIQPVEELDDDDEPVVDVDAGVGVGEGGAGGGGGVAAGGGVGTTVVISAVTVQPLNENAAGAEAWQPRLTTSRTLVVITPPVSVMPRHRMSEASWRQPILRLSATAMTIKSVETPSIVQVTFPWFIQYL